ncbi:unnamed protein product [Anisakis simplex]|uniref:FACT complex subunit n=1 Tax=Anisakis simplex TaxID=6269 RepID=A0A0M3JP00_ANISI|nr:unnamed protein product [Anisakis simplex]
MIKETEEGEEKQEELRRLMLRKWEESDEFKRYVQQGLMKFGGDASLDAMEVNVPVLGNLVVTAACRIIKTGNGAPEPENHCDIGSAAYVTGCIKCFKLL